MKTTKTLIEIDAPEGATITHVAVDMPPHVSGLSQRHHLGFRIIDPAQAVPDGWKLVPVKPTFEMIEVGCKETLMTHDTRLEDAWREMLLAAPSPAAVNTALIDRIESYIPNGDGYNSQYAHDLAEVVGLMRGNKLATVDGAQHEFGSCCYGGIKAKRDCASCRAWKPTTSVGVPDVDELSNFIHRIDGNHTMWTHALAEKICEWLAARPTSGAGAEQNHLPSDDELMAYATEAQFFLFASEDEVLDIMRETLTVFWPKTPPRDQGGSEPTKYPSAINAGEQRRVSREVTDRYGK